MQLLLKNGRIIDPYNSKDEMGDVLIINGRIRTVAKGLKPGPDTKVIDLEGRVLTPGLIDMHVHLREPGFEEKETIATGTKAAAAGGFTCIVAMPNTKPAIDNETTVEAIRCKALSEGVIEVLPCAAITKSRKGEEIAEYGILKKAGAVAISDDGSGVDNPEVMRRAMEYSRLFDLPILSHAEDRYLSGGSMHEGYYSTILGLKGIPGIAEDIAVSRDITLAEYTGAKLHIQHISTKKSVALVREAKAKGLAVTAEAAPHHFTLTDAQVVGYNTSTKVNPPLRSAEDKYAVIEGLLDGTIDAIASDHAPHTLEDKRVEYEYAAFGISGIETSVAVSLHQLYHQNGMSLMALLERFTKGPAEILGLPMSGLADGVMANLTVLDLEIEKAVDTASFLSKGKNSPFQGQVFKGWPVMTIYQGQVIYKA